MTGLTIKKLSILLLAVTGAGCAMTYNPTYFYNETQVVNLTGETITEVSLRVGGGGRTLACAEVVNNALCDDRFGKRRYPQQGLELSWIHGDGKQKSQQLAPAIPAYFATAFPLRIMLEIFEDGTVKAYYEQEEPGRDGGVFIN